MECFKESGTAKTRLDVTQVLSSDVEDTVKSSIRRRQREKGSHDLASWTMHEQTLDKRSAMVVCQVQLRTVAPDQ
jgi:hypothetical protein